MEWDSFQLFDTIKAMETEWKGGGGEGEETKRKGEVHQISDTVKGRATTLHLLISSVTEAINHIYI